MDHQQDKDQNPNPEKLAVTDEKQRDKKTEEGEQPRQTPTGNERDGRTATDGAQAGMGE
jgi:hypothetical protein